MINKYIYIIISKLCYVSIIHNIHLMEFQNILKKKLINYNKPRLL